MGIKIWYSDNKFKLINMLQKRFLKQALLSEQYSCVHMCFLFMLFIVPLKLVH